MKYKCKCSLDYLMAESLFNINEENVYKITTVFAKYGWCCQKAKLSEIDGH